jgi:KaiC/GvpD/RAD55 family RecA-like ATPase
MGTKIEIKEGTDLNQSIDFLIAKPANEWIEEASLRETPRDLFNKLIYEGDLGILFASSGAGKSILACQFANENSGREIVLLLDCELSDKQFQLRYTNEAGERFLFKDKFIRLELNPDAEKPDKLTDEDFLLQSIENCVTTTGAKILIVDNITYLRQDTEKAKEALPLMKKLKAIKKKYDLTVLVIAHTPKRDATKPISQNDLSGSMMLYNFCDQVFAIGTSNTDPNLRYIKQLKTRYTETLYGEDNVILYQVEKNNCFLGFTFLGYGKEADYLRQLSEPGKKDLEDQVNVLHGLGKSLREIAKELKITPSRVYRIINKPLNK